MQYYVHTHNVAIKVIYKIVLHSVAILLCRLGLGAVPPRDTEEHAYNCQLERRIGRKLSKKKIKRRRGEDDNAVAAAAVNGECHLLEREAAHVLF